MEGERGEEQWFPLGGECSERTADFSGEEGGRQKRQTCFLYVTGADRISTILHLSSDCESAGSLSLVFLPSLHTHTQAPHAHTCLMWKLTTYSALVRWTEMAKGSKGWKVKATRRRTAWFTGRPSRPAWILNFSRPESRA